MLQFPRKQYGRIFVSKQEDIKKVHKIIKQMDDFEYGYLPEKLVAVFEPKERIFDNGSKHWMIELEYTHKFDNLDLNKLQIRCWMTGVPIFCVMGGQDTIWIDELKESVE